MTGIRTAAPIPVLTWRCPFANCGASYESVGRDESSRGEISAFKNAHMAEHREAQK
jgi:hypothetical protein